MILKMLKIILKIKILILIYKINKKIRMIIFLNQMFLYNKVYLNNKALIAINNCFKIKMILSKIILIKIKILII